MEGIAWRWQSIDGALLEAPLALELVGPNPTDRGKNGSKRTLLVDAHGVPLSIIVSAANRHDIRQVVPALDVLVAARPATGPRARQHLCADAGFIGAGAKQEMLDRGYTPHVRHGPRSANGGPGTSVRGAGWSKLRTRGSLGFASCWFDTRRRIALTWG
jgi:transposase